MLLFVINDGDDDARDEADHAGDDDGTSATVKYFMTPTMIRLSGL